MAHGDRAGVAVPADLFDAVVELEDLFVRRPDVEVKLRTAAAGAPLAHDLDADIVKIFGRLRHLGDALDLPGDLIDVVFFAEMFGVIAGVLALVEFLLVEQSERVMIAGVAAEVTGAGGFGNKEAKQVEIETPAGFQVCGVETESDRGGES